jgi:hypothetical protein
MTTISFSTPSLAKARAIRHHGGGPGEASPDPSGEEVRGATMTIANIITIQPLVALIAGILILIMPRLLNFIVAIYLIFIGISGLAPHLLK